jgi:hypothetical protein
MIPDNTNMCTKVINLKQPPRLVLILLLIVIICLNIATTNRKCKNAITTAANLITSIKEFTVIGVIIYLS